jgi:hypothetical protein
MEADPGFPDDDPNNKNTPVSKKDKRDKKFKGKKDKVKGTAKKAKNQSIASLKAFT